MKKNKNGNYIGMRMKGAFTKGHKINVGRECSEETRRKIGLKSIGNKNGLGSKRSKEQRKKMGILKTGNKNPQWVEKNPSYGSVHIWLDRHFIKPKHCDFCESSRFLEWALKKGKQHDHNRDNYYCLCSSCHKKYDYTDERRKKLSITHTGRKITWVDKISKANKGKKRTQEVKDKISEYQKQHPRPRNNKGQFYSI